MRRIPIALAGILVLALGAVAVPPAQAATCDDISLTTMPVVTDYNIQDPFDSIDEFQPGAVSVKITGDPACAISNVEAKFLDDYTATEFSAPLSLGSEMDFPPDTYYGGFVPPSYGKGSLNGFTFQYGDIVHNEGLPASVEYTYITDKVSLTGTGPLVIDKGETVPLNGVFASPSMRDDEKINLEVRPVGTQDWKQVDSTSTGTIDNGAFQFAYEPFQPVEYRYQYDATDWAAGAVSAPSTINFVVKPPPCDPAYPDFCIPPPPPDLNCTDFTRKNFTALPADPHRLDADHDGIACEDETPPAKPPSAPPAFVTKTTPTTIALDWAPPADPNGTVKAYRFGWSTPSGKPVPSWEDTYPVADGVPDPIVFTKLNPNTAYSVWVEAVNEHGRSARTTIPTKTAKAPVPVKRASVYVAAVSKAGKLYVNVNPDKGKGYWKFRVQKLSGTKWVNKKAYNTKTSKETRTINLSKGVYRVVVYPKYGYKGVVSKAIRLKK